MWSDKSSANLSRQDLKVSGQSTSLDMVPGQETQNTYEIPLEIVLYCQ